MEKLFYSIGEAAAELGESVSLVRFWTGAFPKLLKPSRTAKGNRQYTRADIDLLKEIHFLVKEKGLTLEGAQKQLSADRSKVGKSVKALESLRRIREQLVEIKDTL